MMKVFSWNVRGLNRPAKQEVKELIRVHSPDICILVEVQLKKNTCKSYEIV